MYYILYVSSANAPFSDSQIEDLLRISRRNNALIGVTGMLLYHDGNFIQYIEGREPNVRNLYGRIAADPRHHGVFELDAGEIERRALPDWTMGYEPANAEVARVFGRFDLRKDEVEWLLDRTLPSTVIAMMRAFYRTAHRFADD